MIGALTVASLGASLYTLSFNPKASFYFPHTRAWELALGAGLVFLPPLGRTAGEAANLMGVALIAIGFATISATMRSRSRIAEDSACYERRDYEADHGRREIE
jgi:peptidoglycan/LPS O-acetylase OafA/YrhL